MNQKTTDQTESSVKKVLDFLYIDDDRIKSIIAHIFNRIPTKLTESEQKNGSKSKNIEGSIQFASLKLGFTNEKGSTEETTFDIYQSFILELIKKLQLPTIDNISDAKTRTLIDIYSRISLIDYDFLKNASPFFIKYHGSPNNPKASIDKKILQKAQDFINVQKNITKLILKTKDNAIVTGTLNKNYLKIPAPEISVIYGSSLPDYWHVVGFYDKISESDKLKPQEVNEVLSYITEFNKYHHDHTTHNNGQQAITHAIIPILIYRTISY